ncbi:MAG: 50S ribosome-binding GTPase [Lachnospiraceae bacterium]|nr:50S ribosome-binding GTPase [Lachnospiraceae bacterium]
MPFDVVQDEELDLEDLFEDISISDSNMYIANEDKAVELISELIKNQTNTSIYFQKRIENRINKLFSLFSEVSIENEMIFYERFMDLCSRLSERQKIQKIQDKVVISFGGKVSAGKSKFINTISGIGDKLPVDQKTTTAIPTYIIKATKDMIYANSMYGYSSIISPEALNAMAHEFDNVYGFGFPSFVDSIIIESNDYALSDQIALLDTPGYTKYDEKSDSKMVISDRQKAYDQLSVSDYLIWLIDIDSGAITEDDIQFIESLRIKTPILIVFTKADLKSDKEIKQIIEVAKETVSQTTIECFGVTAYSANLQKEYGNNVIKQFLNYTVSGSVRNSDIIAEFKHVENDMREAIIKAINQAKSTANGLFTYISKSDKILEIRSLAMLWGKANQDGYELDKLLKSYDGLIREINIEISKYFREEESV